MKIYSLFVFTVLSLCLNYSSQSEVLDSYASHVLQRRAAVITKTPAPPTKKEDSPFSNPDIKTHLTTSSQVFTTLGDIQRVDNFAQKYFSIKPLRLVTALKGVSIAAAIFASFLNVPNEETEKILKNMNKKFDTMFKKMDSQISELKSYIDQKFLNTFILAPIKTAEEGMNTYKKKPNAATMAAFLERTKAAKLSEVVNHILLNTRDYLTNTMKNSRYNISAVQTMSGILIHAFHKAYVIETYRNGIEFQDKLLVERMDLFEEQFLNTVKAYKKISNEVFNDFDATFSDFIADDIIKPIIDEDDGDSCTKAGAIIEKLATDYSWRQYFVIVSDQSKPYNFGYSGVPNRMIALDPYNGYFVLLFIATEDFEKKKKAYTAAAERDKISAVAEMNFYDGGYPRMAYYAKQNEKDYQMAVLEEPMLRTNYKRCLRQSNVKATDEFVVEITIYTKTLFNFKDSIKHVVVF